VGAVADAKTEPVSVLVVECHLADRLDSSCLAPIQEVLDTAVRLHEDYIVRGAATAEEGLREQRRAPADTVLVDLMLPGVDGFECIRQLRVREDVPIVVVSARDDTHDIVAALEAGSDVRETGSGSCVGARPAY
jgi:CheY-like chemotaxis protein